MIKQPEHLLNMDVYDEKFQIAFKAMLEKFVNEFDDMAYMGVIKKASDLLDEINNI